MDTAQTPGKDAKAKVAADIERIRCHMPHTYKAIQAKAAEIGPMAYGLVKKACAGAPDAFYAMEAGHVVGTPFARSDIGAEVAKLMVTFGVDHVVIWANAEVSHGAH
jgi:hypothetical protein